jgi:hypothetical protein
VGKGTVVWAGDQVWAVTVSLPGSVPQTELRRLPVWLHASLIAMRSPVWRWPGVSVAPARSFFMVLFKVAYVVVLSLFGVMCVVAGIFEVIARRRPPGRLFGRGVFPRNAPQVSDSWGASEWRKNGSLVFGVGVILLLVVAFVLLAP